MHAQYALPLNEQVHELPTQFEIQMLFCPSKQIFWHWVVDGPPVLPADTEPPPALPEHDIAAGGLTLPHCGRPGPGSVGVPCEHIENAACSALHPEGMGFLGLYWNGVTDR